MILRLAAAAMGTRFELVLAPRDARDEVRLRAAGEAALERVEECDRRYSLFRSDSLVSLVNREACAREVRLDEEAYALFEVCLDAWRASDGAFDLTAGVRCQAPAAQTQQEPGTELDLASDRDDADGAWLRFGPPSRCLAPYRLDPERRTIRLLAPDASLDLGGVAKGFALDQAAAILRENGLGLALFHGGTSSVVALGAPPGSKGWSVRLAATGERLELCDAALSVSAPHGRTLERDGRSLGHIVDPACGASAPLGLSAAVSGPSATLCEVWSTALVVLAARGAHAPGLPTGYAARVSRASLSLPSPALAP